MKVSSMGIALLATLLLGSGCALLDPVEVGEKTYTEYDEKGVPISVTESKEAVGDKMTEYRKSVEAVVEQATSAHNQALENVKEMTEPKEGDDEKDRAYKSSMGILATVIISDKYSVEDAIAVLHYGKDKYDVSSDAIDAGAEVLGVALDKYADAKILKYAFDAAGNRIASTITGDGNENDQRTKEINSDINAGTKGDGSPVNIDNPQGKGEQQQKEDAAQGPYDDSGMLCNGTGWVIYEGVCMSEESAAEKEAAKGKE